MKIVSACLVGLCTNYQGKHNALPELVALFNAGELIPVCPEQLGGLPTPRLPAEIVDGCSKSVLIREAKVLQTDGTDVTEAFLRGAAQVLIIARSLGPEYIVFKERSPSCGVHWIYDGGHTGTLSRSCGVTTALLRQNGFKVISDEDFLRGEDRQ